MKKRCLGFNVQKGKANYNIPWIKAGSQTTKHAAIRMLLWQDAAVLRDTAVLSMQLAWSHFAEYNCYSHC